VAAVFLVFGIVSAKSQGFTNLLLRRSLAKNQKSSLRIGYSIFLNRSNFLDTFGVVRIRAARGLMKRIWRARDYRLTMPMFQFICQ